MASTNWEYLAGKVCGVCGEPATIAYNPYHIIDGVIFRCCGCCNYVDCCHRHLTHREAKEQHERVMGTKEPEYD